MDQVSGSNFSLFQLQNEFNIVLKHSGTGTKPRTGEAYSVSGQEHVLFADSLDIDAQ